MRCPFCTNEAVHHSTYGWIPCLECQNKHKKVDTVQEVTTDDIKEQRKVHADDIIQPYREGVLSSEYVEKYGNKRLANKTDKPEKVWEGYYD